MAAPLVLRNAAVIAPLVVLNSVGYLWLNEHHLRPPVELPLWPIDRAMPLLHWTIWPYLVLMISDGILPLALRDRRVFRDTVLAYGVAIATNFLVWTVCPTTYPRPPLPAGSSLTDVAFRMFMALDTPASCFPSGHITIPAVACWGFVRERPHLRVPVWAAMGLFSLTVMTTKQHYFADILGGLGTALLGVVVVKRWARGQPDAGAA